MKAKLDMARLYAKEAYDFCEAYERKYGDEPALYLRKNVNRKNYNYRNVIPEL